MALLEYRVLNAFLLLGEGGGQGGGVNPDIQPGSLRTPVVTCLAAKPRPGSACGSCPGEGVFGQEGRRRGSRCGGRWRWMGKGSWAVHLLIAIWWGCRAGEKLSLFHRSTDRTRINEHVVWGSTGVSQNNLTIRPVNSPGGNQLLLARRVLAAHGPSSLRPKDSSLFYAAFHPKPTVLIGIWVCLSPLLPPWGQHSLTQACVPLPSPSHGPWCSVNISEFELKQKTGPASPDHKSPTWTWNGIFGLEEMSVAA